MPWNVSPTTYFVGPGKRTEREILKFPVGLGAIRSVVIDASTVALRADDDIDGFGHRRVLERGQVLCKNPATPTKYMAYSAAAGQVPAGVLDNDVEFLDATAASDEAANMLWFGAIFKASMLIGYTGNESAIAAALDTCRFE